MDAEICTFDDQAPYNEFSNYTPVDNYNIAFECVCN